MTMYSLTQEIQMNSNSIKTAFVDVRAQIERIEGVIAVFDKAVKDVNWLRDVIEVSEYYGLKTQVDRVPTPWTWGQELMAVAERVWTAQYGDVQVPGASFGSLRVLIEEVHEFAREVHEEAQTPNPYDGWLKRVEELCTALHNTRRTMYITVEAIKYTITDKEARQ